MNIKLLNIAGILAATIAAPVFAEESRIAYSRSAGVEVLGVDNWCGETAKIKMKASRSFFQNGGKVYEFAPKIGLAVLPKECVQASKMMITGVDSSGNEVYAGTASKDGGWKLTQVSATAAAAPSSKPKESTPIAAQKLPGEEKPAVASVSAPQSTEPQTNAPTNASKTAEKVKPEVSRGTNFEVAGWSPELGPKSLFREPTNSDLILKDQNGCFVRMPGHTAEGDSSRMVITKGLVCDDGFVSGTGTAELKRGDGVLLHRYSGFFNYGYAFDKRLSGKTFYPVSRFDTKYRNRNSKRIFAYIGSDNKLETHHFALFSMSNSGSFNIDDDFFGLTTKSDDFLNADSIKSQVLSVIGSVEKSFGGKHDVDSIAYMDTFPRDFETFNKQKLYSLGVRTTYRGDKTPQYNRATNFVYSEKLKKEREAKQEAERIAAEKVRLEVDKRRTYESLTSNKSEAMRSKLYLVGADSGDKTLNIPHRIWTYDSSQIFNIAVGRQSPVAVMMMVHIDDIDDEVGITSWPYKMQLDLSTFELEEGWNMLYGTLIGDADKRDEDGLIMPIVTVTAGYECQTEGCEDRVDVLQLVRDRYQDPEWVYEQ